MQKFLLLDGYNLAFRSFYAVPELSRADGLPTHAVHGWVRTVWRLTDLERPFRTLAFFDSGGSRRHLELWPEYKANRAETPESFRVQVPYIQKLTEAMGIPVVQREGVEADDLLASLARQLAEAGHEVLIVSADKDFGQCLGGGIQQLLPPPTANPRLGWRRLDAAGLEEKLGVVPAQVPDYLALIGDASDNIPGLPGVGPKTAVKWLKAYGDVAGILAAADGLLPARFQQVVKDSAALLERNLRLVTLDRACSVALPEALPVSHAALRDLFVSLDMHTAAREAAGRFEPTLF